MSNVLRGDTKMQELVRTFIHNTPVSTSNQPSTDSQDDEGPIAHQSFQRRPEVCTLHRCGLTWRCVGAGREVYGSQQSSKKTQLCLHIEHGVNAVVLCDVGDYDEGESSADRLSHDHHCRSEGPLFRREPYGAETRGRDQGKRTDGAYQDVSKVNQSYPLGSRLAGYKTSNPHSNCQDPGSTQHGDT